MNDKYDKAGILISPTVKLESEMDIESVKKLLIAYGSSLANDCLFLINSLQEENARLQSVIDAANAQEPALRLNTMGGAMQWNPNYKGDWSGEFYARPIPAQQSPAVVAVPDGSLFFDSNPEERFDECYDVDELKKCIFNLYEDIRCLKEDTKSPRITESEVAVPDVEMLATIIRKVDGNHSLGASALAEKIIGEIRGVAAQSPRITEQCDKLAGLVVQELYNNGGPHESQLDEARRIIGFIASRLPQRVTEQDRLNETKNALEQLLKCSQGNFNSEMRDVALRNVRSGISALLNKLNKVNHETN